MSTIKIRRGTTAQWTAANPVLTAGEIGLQTDGRILRVGDGAAAFLSLEAIGLAALASAPVDIISAQAAADAAHGDATDALADALAAADAARFPMTLIADGSNVVTGFILTAIPATWKLYASTLKGLHLGSIVTSIGASAFEYCTGFTGPLILPASLTTIGNYAFSGAGGFTGSLVIPPLVTAIPNNGFDSCGNFTGPLVLPIGLLTIGEYGFTSLNCTGRLILPETLQAIWASAFSSCTGFTGALVIPDSVTTVYYGAFSGCTGLGPIYANLADGDFQPSAIGSTGAGTFYVTAAHIASHGGVGAIVGSRTVALWSSYPELMA